ncbi:ATP-binding protein, partial [Acinetobacter baumannii]
IDNSISAGAKDVHVEFVWNGAKSRISIADNGRGMTDTELESAMRLGDRNPLDVRTVNDLGRFSMGLKTASFSQCRRLTVKSIKNGTES